jgi:hypothetical protein
MDIFASTAIALYAAHHVGDYWVQTDHQARHKGLAGREGRAQCMLHCATYVLTQAVFLAILTAVTGLDTSPVQLGLALAISGMTHYMADRREHGLMFWLARFVGLYGFLMLGVPRPLTVEADAGTDVTVPLDNPQLATGAWALDQSWHIFWGVFVAALVLAA